MVRFDRFSFTKNTTAIAWQLIGPVVSHRKNGIEKTAGRKVQKVIPAKARDASASTRYFLS